MNTIARATITAKLVVVVCLLMLPYYSTTSRWFGCKNVMLNCLRDAGLKPTDVDGVNMQVLQLHWEI
jgi:hypothetical protein